MEIIQQDLNFLVENGDIATLKQFLLERKIFKVGDILLTAQQYEIYEKETKLSEYNDMLQGVRKVLLKI